MTIEEKQAKIKEYCNTVTYVNCALYHSEFYSGCVDSCYGTKNCKKINDMFNYLRDKGLITIPQEKQCCDYDSGNEDLEGEELGELTIEQMRKIIEEYCNYDDSGCNTCPLNGCKYCFSSHASDAEIIENYEKIKDYFKPNKDVIKHYKDDKNKIIIYGNDYVELINVLSRNGYSTCMVTKADDCGIPFEDLKHEIVFWRDDNNIDDAMGYQE